MDLFYNVSTLALAHRFRGRDSETAYPTWLIQPRASNINSKLYLSFQED